MKQLFKEVVRRILPANDKLKHYYLWSLFFFMMVYGFDLIDHLVRIRISDWWAFGIVIYTAAWKELYHDWYCGKGTAEYKDFFAGIAIATLYMYKTY